MATTAGTAEVYWDSVESYKTEAGVETSDYVYSLATIATTKQLWIAKKEADNSVGALGAKKHKLAWMVSPVATKWIKLVNNGTDIFAGGTGETYNTATGHMVISGNKTLDLASIINSSHITRATATEATLSAVLGGAGELTVTFATVSNSGGASGTVTGERYTTGAAKIAATSDAAVGGANIMDSDDYVTFTVGSNSVTATGGATGTLATAIATNWIAKYGNGGAGTASPSFNGHISASAENGTVHFITQSHTLAADFPTIAVGITTSGTIGTSAEGLDWKIGTTVSAGDNTVESNNIIVMLESNEAGTLLDKLVSPALTGSATINALTTTVRSNTVDASEKVFGDSANLDAPSARLAEDAVGGTASSAVTFTRTHWFN